MMMVLEPEKVVLEEETVVMEPEKRKFPKNNNYSQ
jgi:hypothetical protein